MCFCNYIYYLRQQFVRLRFHLVLPGIVIYLLFLSPISIYAATGYPRIYNLWGNFNEQANANYFSGFALYMMYSDGSSAIQQSRADAIHALNPDIKILVTADIIPAHPVGGGLDTQPQWWSAQPGTPDYACILRDSKGNILRDVTYNAAYNNLGNRYCRDVLVNHFKNRWNTSGGHYDGWQVDQAGDAGVIWTLGTDIDSNVDGIADDPVTVDREYIAGMMDIFSRLRAAFPGIIINGNDSPPYYGQWVNGRLYEMDLKRYLDKEYSKPWPEIFRDWTSWTANTTLAPNTTGLLNSPSSSLITSKYTFQNIWTNIKPEMMAEYGTDYNRMRFGLASALMVGAMYTYDLSGYMYGVNWWYDEYGIRGQPSSIGYLGQPTGPPVHISRLTAPDQAVNGNFTSGTSPWFTNTSGSGVTASLTVENGVARIQYSGAVNGWATFRENYVSVEAGKYYTISFRAKASNNRYGGFRVQRAGGAWENLSEAKQVRFYTDWTEYNLPVRGLGSGTNGTLLFDLGTTAGDLYFDDISFREGVMGIWQRHFDFGTVLLNESPVAQTVVLDKTYRKLTGSQAPLFAKKLDNDAVVASGPWTSVAAGFDQWGSTVHQITAPNSTASLTYVFPVPYPGEYEVLAWVAPAVSNSKNVTVSINNTDRILDESTGVLGWHSLGKFNFIQSASVVIKPLGTGTVIGDAIKIVSTNRYNDGSLVNQISLQPDDAVILLNIPISATVSPSPTSSPRPIKPGDADGDGRVTGFDYVVWLMNYGRQTGNGGVEGDFNNDTYVNGFDYVVWLTNYGS